MYTGYNLYDFNRINFAQLVLATVPNLIEGKIILRTEGTIKSYERLNNYQETIIS